jgi:hypothetical protein
MITCESATAADGAADAAVPDAVEQAASAASARGTNEKMRIWDSGWRGG